VQDEFGGFAKYAWAFVDGKPVVNRWKSLKQLPATSKVSDAWS
jgi:DNA-3-methyladenine glycosylase I